MSKQTQSTLAGWFRFGHAILSCVWPIRSGYDVVRIVEAVLLIAAGFPVVIDRSGVHERML